MSWTAFLRILVLHKCDKVENLSARNRSSHLVILSINSLCRVLSKGFTLPQYMSILKCKETPKTSYFPQNDHTVESKPL